MNAAEHFDVFLSYSNLKEATQLHTFLTDLGCKVWFEEIEVAPGKLKIDTIADGIKNSKIFMCCINTEYVNSKAKKDELLYAHSLEMPIIPIMLENLSVQSLSGIGYCINRPVRVELFHYTIRAWSKEIKPGKTIVQAIQYCLKESNFLPVNEPKKEEKVSLQRYYGVEYYVIGDEEECDTYREPIRRNLFNTKPKDRDVYKMPLLANESLKAIPSAKKVTNEEIGKSLPLVDKSVRFSNKLFTVYDVGKWVNKNELHPETCHNGGQATSPCSLTEFKNTMSKIKHSSSFNVQISSEHDNQKRSKTSSVCSIEELMNGKLQAKIACA